MASTDTERSRRFARRRTDDEGSSGDERLDALLAELVLLREENARLKVAEHKGPGIEALLVRTRALSAARSDDADGIDESEQLLVEGLVIRESLLEICRHVERAMASFEARLRALHPGAEEQLPAPLRAMAASAGEHWSAPPNGQSR